MAKRRTTMPRKLRDRRGGQSPYQKYNKKEYRYSWQRKDKNKAEPA